jgi:hypothetical protein
MAPMLLYGLGAAIFAAALFCLAIGHRERDRARELYRRECR